jgi:hypothetical protein
VRGWRGSTSYIKGGIWVEGRDIIDSRFSKDGTSINEVYFEDHVWILNNVKSKRSSPLSTFSNGASSIVHIDRKIYFLWHITSLE